VRFQFCSSFLIVFICWQILLILRHWLYGMELVQCFGWQLAGERYCRFCVEVGVNGVVVQDDCGVKEQHSLH